MAIYVVSDLHGAEDRLRKALPEGATLLLLGDLVNLIDYISKTGILYDVFSRDAVDRVSDLRARGDFEGAREVIRARSEGRDEEIRSEIGLKIAQQYESVFAALPDPTYLILGNVDSPPLAASLAGRTPAVTLVDGRIVELEGERFGFVGGALPTPLHVAGEVSEEEMRAKIDALGEVDVLCSHIPPAIPELCFDTVAGKAERGSEDILQYIRDVQPRRAYFGHVHQPLVSAMRIGRTLTVNVGYFRGTGKAFPHER